jgi:4-hydroxythreonine-4-phosphate dehydrogenase
MVASASNADMHRHSGPVIRPDIIRLPLALTQGDPAGIGPELALKAWMQREGMTIPPFAYVGDIAHVSALARSLELDVKIVSSSWEQACSDFGTAFPVIATGHAVTVNAGRPNAAAAPGTLAAIKIAVDATVRGKAGAVVTNPIAKHVLYAAGFRHPGHTEYLAELARRDGGPAPRPVMMIWSEELAVVPVTIHIPLKEVSVALTEELIFETARIVDRDLRQHFGIARPRLALCGLNPHAGENGALGLEDDAVIRPAIAKLKTLGIDASGPWPADTLFHARARDNYDVALGMYHDQVLVPVKTIAFDEGVNVTLGLPFLRTSPDHGTAFDIAGKGIASPDSLIAALKLAARMAANNVVARP